MGMVNTEITIKNLRDGIKAEIGALKPEDIRTATVTAVVDTGSMYLVITEDLFQKLGLYVKEERFANTANGQSVPCKVTESVEVQWKNRRTEVPTLVIPGAKKNLFGAIPMEAMDLMVCPRTQEIVGAHGDQIEILALSSFDLH